jgi:hypothetical protein
VLVHGLINPIASGHDIKLELVNHKQMHYTRRMSNALLQS